MKSDHEKIRILFVCTENSCRSQMAEACTRMHNKESVEVFSAGSQASGTINPKAIQLMETKGYDLTKHRSKSLNEIPPVSFDYVISMGCGDACPHVPGKHREDWQLPDPRDMDLEEFSQIYDQIEVKVKQLLSSL